MDDVNYNDGEWHGWKGDECPVHPQSLVAFAWRDKDGFHENGDVRGSVWPAGEIQKWSMVAAFCVIEEYIEPRDYYFSASCPMVFDSREKAEAYAAASGNRSPLIHARQVKKETK